MKEKQHQDNVRALRQHEDFLRKTKSETAIKTLKEKDFLAQEAY